MKMRGMAVLILMWCGYALLAEARAGAGILYVDDTASGAGDGSSWCDAYVHLQDALAAATVPGSAIAEIRVAEGLYRPDQGIAQNPGDRWATFQLHNAIALRGGYAGCGAGDPDDRDIGAYETVLSGDLAQDDGPGFVNYDENAYTVVAGSGTDATAVLDGFTISGGCANGEGGGAADSGAGMYNDTGSPTIIDCTFVHNVATQYGGGMGNRFDANPMITNCRFIGNVTFYRGGAMSVNRGSPKLFNCMFTGNSAYEGGAVSAFWADVELTNCTMVGNVAYDGGGLAAQIGGDECVAPIVRNSIFWANSATSEPEASSQVYSDPSGACPGATPTIEYTCVQGGWSGAGGIGNITDPPAFVDADGPDNVTGTLDDNVRLEAFSPCLDAGDNAAIPPDLSDLDEDGNTAEPVPYDLAGNQRVLDGVVDMGAYEGPNQAFVLSADTVVVPEGGSAEFTVALLIDPLGSVEITVQHQSGDADISVLSGGTLAFDSDNFDTPQTVVLAAATDADFEPGIALVQVSGSGFYSSGVTAREADNEPAPGAVRVDETAPPGGDGLTWGTAFDDLQDALAYVKQLDGAIGEIWVSRGTYFPSKPLPGPYATFQLLSGTTLYGGFAGGETDASQRDPGANVTILSGDIEDDDFLPPDGGSCCAAHPEPGCDDTDCEAAVCAVDPSCCDTEWSEYCASITSGWCLCGNLCTHQCDNSYHVVTGSGTDATAVLDGFTITAGIADDVIPYDKGGGMYNGSGDPTVNNCRFEANTGIEGGAMANIASGPTLTNCTFLFNEGTQGGGMYNKYSSPTVTDCEFTQNQAWEGGAIHDLSSDTVITRCAFIDNQANHPAGGAGGAIVGHGSNLVIQDCLFSQNYSYFFGGACQLYYGTAMISDCVFDGNIAYFPGGGGEGGALSVSGGVLLMPRCRFLANLADYRGGAVCLSHGAVVTQINGAFYGNEADDGGAYYIQNASAADVANSVFDGNTGAFRSGGAFYLSSGNSLSLTNCTLAHNTAEEGGALYSRADLGPPNTVTVSNSILWDNGMDPVRFESGIPTTNYNCIEGFGPPLVGVGNIATDPQFIDPAGPDHILGTEDDNLRLYPHSPCIDAGDNTVVPADAADLDDDGDLGEPLPFDLREYSRFFDDPATPDTGDGFPPIVDMGAYEYALDCNENGVLDEYDIADGTSEDENGNGIPDECECTGVSAPQPDPALTDTGFGTKNRYLSFQAGDPERPQAIRVTFISLPGYEYAEGRQMWVQAPSDVTEASGSSDSTPLPTFRASTLGCTPFYADWSTEGTVDVDDAAILPGAQYDIQVISFGCATTDEARYSPPLSMGTSAAGDVVGDCAAYPCTPPQGVVDFVDISAVVDKFKNEPAALRKARADVVNSNTSLPEPDKKVDFVDISCIVDAFRGTPCALPAPPMEDPCAP